ncbi:MAG: hypothetical protein ISR96_06955 [Nitrospira sp.]|nr:hypothetical protein [bacterium]MBL7049233.1 hypothetical protein [Nitrospira sp.]
MTDEPGLCYICREQHTRIYVEIAKGVAIHLCAECIRKTKDNFIWLCLSCGKSYIKPKYHVIAKVKDRELKKAYMLCEDMMMIQGIDLCIACSPERMVDYLEMQQPILEC